MPGSANDFSIVDRREFLDTQQEAQQTFTMLLASIAGRQPPRRRHRHHEHHARQRHGTDARDRHPHGARRHALQHHAAVPRRVRHARACSAARSESCSARCAARTLSRFAGWEVFVSPESVGLAVGVQRRRRAVLRHLARAPRRASRSDRSAALRVAPDGRSCASGASLEAVRRPRARARLHGLRAARSARPAIPPPGFHYSAAARPLATPFDSFERTPVELSEPFDETRTHEIAAVRLSARAAATAIPQNLVEGQYFRSKEPGTKSLVVVMPIWGTSSYPPAKISTRLRAPRRQRHARHLDLRHGAGVPVDGAEHRCRPRTGFGRWPATARNAIARPSSTCGASSTGPRRSPRSTRRASRSSASA